MGDGNIDQREWGRMVADVDNLKDDVQEIKSVVKEIANQVNITFKVIGDKERLEKHSLKLSIVKDYATIAFWALIVIVYVVKHPF